MKEFKIEHRELGMMLEEDNLLICGARIQTLKCVGKVMCVQ